MQSSCKITASCKYSNHDAGALCTTNSPKLQGVHTIVFRVSIGATKCLFHWTSVVRFPFRKLFKGWSYYSALAVIITDTVCWWWGSSLRHWRIVSCDSVHSLQRTTFYILGRKEFYGLWCTSLDEYQTFGGNFCFHHQCSIFSPPQNIYSRNTDKYTTNFSCSEIPRPNQNHELVCGLRQTHIARPEFILKEYSCCSHSVSCVVHVH